MMFALIEHHLTLAHGNGATRGLNLRHLLGRQPIEKMSADVQPLDGLAHEQGGFLASGWRG